MLWLQQCNRRKCQNNCIFCKENIKKSCWYSFFTRHRLTCKISHALSSSNYFGGICHWFCMPLAKVEEFTTFLIHRGYITRPRSHCCRKVFCECLELLVMAALHFLATGATFCSWKPLCGISISGEHTFFTFSARPWWK